MKKLLLLLLVIGTTQIQSKIGYSTFENGWTFTEKPNDKIPNENENPDWDYVWITEDPIPNEEFTIIDPNFLKVSAQTQQKLRDYIWFKIYTESTLDMDIDEQTDAILKYIVNNPETFTVSQIYQDYKLNLDKNEIKKILEEE